ncbi:MAG: ABC transporter permease [Acidimicrobiales bacterium]
MAVDAEPVPITRPSRAARPATRRRWRPSARVVLPIITGLCLLGIWQLVAETLLPSFVARPIGIIQAVPSVLTSSASTNGLSHTGTFWTQVAATCGSVIEGMAIGTVVGMFLGLLMGQVDRVRWFFTPYVQSLYAMPLIALVPLVTLWFGYSSTTRLIVVLVAAVLPVTVTTADGARDTSKSHLDVGRVFGAKRRNLWFGIALPSAVPHVMAGVQVGMARAITNAVAAEVLSTVPGLGLATFTKSSSFHENEAFVYVVTLALFAVLARSVILYARRKLAPWYTPTG